MLPEAKDYLMKDSYDEQTAGLIIMACFVGGFFGIQAISRLVHQYMPSHVVDCDHSHDENKDEGSRSRRRSTARSTARSRTRQISRKSVREPNVGKIVENGEGGEAAETTPLLANGKQASQPLREELSQQEPRPVSPLASARGRSVTNDPAAIARRPSMQQVQKRVMSFVRDTKCNCEGNGSCYGFSDPCGQECFKHLSSNRAPMGHRTGTMLRTTTGPFYPQSGSVFHGSHSQQPDADQGSIRRGRFRTSRATSRDPLSPVEDEDSPDESGESSSATIEDDGDAESQHHHHVPTNAFLSIGLQTSIAIALHKFPEGFITYATNHANPALGFNVFMALFVHNISEGFAMALPLYMALHSRWKAMLWSAILGGLSQPVGAGIAVLWFHIASRKNITPNPVAYACIFAITAGIMVSVALQLFVESLSLNHNRNLCIFFGFLGMAILGVSNALLGGH